MRNKFYSGVGSRDLPEDAADNIAQIASTLSKLGYTVRSGGANGADTAFEENAGDLKEIFLPWRGFNRNKSPLFVTNDTQAQLYELAKKYHPAWNKLGTSAKLLMARNGQQVFGENLDDPVEFLICWTPDGCTSHKKRNKKTGGTGQAISLASDNGIPVYNLANKESAEQLYIFLATL